MKLNIVPAARGFQWVQLGFRTFLKQPLALAALVFLYATLGLAMLVVPLLGPFLACALVPVATLGLMAATRVAQESAFPMPTVLFTGLRASRERVRAMLALGAFYAAAILVLAIVVALLVPVPAEGKTAMEIAQSDEFRLRVTLTAVFYIPFSLAFWHAPALVHWHGVPAVKSLFFSFVACIRNLRAFAMYALAWVGIAIAVLAASGVAAAVSQVLAAVVFGATSTIATIAFYISLYFTFRDSFLDDPEETPGGP
ncbi:BPSS1780 family membrane protein [Ramlibacter sp. PS4R-6]|uniref:BPSS1780 family membrane protein n=1 Tax=Ramlibacter sp. PS4R-6 TaxID=3133438 RepID=UPI0030A8F37C